MDFQTHMTWKNEQKPHAIASDLYYSDKELVSRVIQSLDTSVQILSMGVATGYMSIGLEPNTFWSERGAGVLMLVADYLRRTYHIKFYSFQTDTLDQEISEECYKEQNISMYCKLLKRARSRMKINSSIRF